MSDRHKNGQKSLFSRKDNGTTLMMVGIQVEEHPIAFVWKCAPSQNHFGNHNDLDEFRKVYLVLINVV